VRGRRQNGNAIATAQAMDSNGRLHLATGPEGSCDGVLRLGINNTVSGFFSDSGFVIGPPAAKVCVTVEVEEDESTSRSRMTASRLAYLLASCGRTGSMYPCFLGAPSRGRLVRRADLGTVTVLTVITPDLGTGEGVAVNSGKVCGVDDVEDETDTVVNAFDELDLLVKLDELRDKTPDVVEDVWESRPVVFWSVAGIDMVEREAGGRGLAETVRGGKMVE
jgi:hypothetical protein